MTKILMVCLGNICRSPLAHGILQNQLSSDEFFIDSAGTGAYHVGHKPDERSIKVARSNGLDISNQRARQFKVSDFDHFDYIYAMDHSNFLDIVKLARNENDISKVKLFLEVNKSVTNKNVPDPYFGGEDGFKKVYQLILETCKILESVHSSKKY